MPAAMISPVTASLPTTDPGRSVLPAAPALPIAALEKLPAGPVGADPVWRLVAAFLVGYPPATARAYLGDLRAWIGWCTEEGVHPFTARRHHVDHWARHLATLPQPATGRPAAAATIARRLSCLSGFYDCGLREVELLEYSPVANVRRPAGLHHQLALVRSLARRAGCRTSRTPWATPTPAPPAATTAPGTTSTGTPPLPDGHPTAPHDRSATGVARQGRRRRPHTPVIARLVSADGAEEWWPARAVRWTEDAVLIGYESSPGEQKSLRHLRYRRRRASDPPSVTRDP